MPLHHTNGVNNQLIAPFLAGASVVLAERFRAEEIEDQIADYGVTYLTGVPTMYSRVLPHLRGGARLRSLRFLRCGSAPITEGLHEEVEAAFGVPLIVSYGLSEATCTSTMNPVGARRIGTVGTVLHGQRVRIFVTRAPERKPRRSAEGEIRIAGACLMKGYAGGEVGVADSQDGWLRTGDLGRFDGDRYLSVTGRLKDVIVRGGETLSPRLDRGCPGPPSGHRGMLRRRRTACRSRRSSRWRSSCGVAALPVDAAELSALVGRQLSRSHVPAAIRFLEALPVNAVGKVDRRALLARAQ